MLLCMTGELRLQVVEVWVTVTDSAPFYLIRTQGICAEGPVKVPNFTCQDPDISCELHRVTKYD